MPEVKKEKGQNESLDLSNDDNQNENENENKAPETVESVKASFVEADTQIFKFNEVLTPFVIAEKITIDSWTKEKSKYKENEGLELLDSDIATQYGYNCLPITDSNADKVCKSVGYYPCFISYTSFNEGQRVLVQKIAGKFVLKAIR